MAFSRLPPTDCWRTATPPRWWTATARSAGCACPGMTARRCSRRSSIRPAGTGGSDPPASTRSERRYVDGTLVIESTFTTETGTVKLTDAMAFAEGQRHHELGMGAPHLLLRVVEGVSGEVELELELAPRPEYGLVKPLFRQTEERRTDVRGTQPGRVQLRVSIARSRTRRCARAFTVMAGEQRRVRLAVGARRTRRRRSRSQPSGSPSASRTRSRRGARGRTSTTSTRARTASWSGSAPVS